MLFQKAYVRISDVRAVGCSSNKAPSSKTKQSSELEEKIIERFRELL
jgi:hypothetical protein